jgi:hypothetical protein
MLQPLDTVINRPFKAQIQCSCREWVQKTLDMALTGHLKEAILAEICQWILNG